MGKDIFRNPHLGGVMLAYIDVLLNSKVRPSITQQKTIQRAHSGATGVKEETDLFQREK